MWRGGAGGGPPAFSFGASSNPPNNHRNPAAVQQDEQEQAWRLQADVEQRLTAHNLPVPDFSNPQSCWAAMNLLQMKIKQSAASTPYLGAGNSRGLARDPNERHLEELRQKSRSYAREVSKLERKLEEAEAQAQALEAYAPPEESDPIALLKSIRRKADMVLGERITTRHHHGGVLGGQGQQLPLTDQPDEEAKRWVARRLLGQL